MKLCLFIVLGCCAPLAHAGNCVDKHARDPTFVALAVPENAPRPADVSAFSVIDATITVEKLTWCATTARSSTTARKRTSA